MNLLLEVILISGLLLDACGIIGLGLLGLAAVKLTNRDKSWGGTMMASGAISLIVARLFYVLSTHFMTDEFQISIGRFGISVPEALPPLLLSFGLAGIVWGLWGHERWLNEESS